MNYGRFLSRLSAARRPSPIRATTEILAVAPPSMISLAPGYPNPNLFPFLSSDFLLRDGTTLTLTSSDMSKALQYGPSAGLPAVVDRLKSFVQLHHNPPTLGRPADLGGLDLMVSIGNADGLYKAFEMLLEEGDSILIDSPTYSGSLSALIPRGVKCLDIETDELGMRPDVLQKVIDANEAAAPKVILTVPNGSNPTGASLDLARKQEIYQIAQKHDIIILEDDPYYFLQYSKERTPSFLSMDIDGRVIRFDSFSKVLSSGLRFGFVSGPRPLIHRMILHQQCSNVQNSSLAQMLVLRLLEQWGDDKFEEHVQSIVSFYRNQKDLMMEACNKYLKGLAEWHEPKAGMFLWIKLLGIEDTQELISKKALEKEVLLLPGLAFYSSSDVKSSYVRASFSLASPQEIDEGIRRLADLIKSEHRV